MDNESEYLYKARLELRAADHSIYANLKYTRSRDVLKNILDRLSCAYRYSILAILTKAQEERIIQEIPADFKSQEVEFRKIFPEMEEYMDRYRFLRKVISCKDFSCNEEFRKNITLIFNLDDKETRINAEDIGHYYVQAKQFLKEIMEILERDLLRQEKDEIE